MALANLYYHPKCVHFPLALFPVSFVSFLLYTATGAADFETGAFVAAGFGVVSMPLAILSGFLDWRIRYKAFMTSIFRIKIVSAFVLFALSALAVMLRILVRDVAAFPLGGLGWAYGALLGATVPLCIVLGHYGGKLVFH